MTFGLGKKIGAGELRTGSGIQLKLGGGMKDGKQNRVEVGAGK